MIDDHRNTSHNSLSSNTSHNSLSSLNGNINNMHHHLNNGTNGNTNNGNYNNTGNNNRMFNIPSPNYLLHSFLEARFEWLNFCHNPFAKLLFLFTLLLLSFTILSEPIQFHPSSPSSCVGAAAAPGAAVTGAAIGGDHQHYHHDQEQQTQPVRNDESNSSSSSSMAKSSHNTTSSKSIYRYLPWKRKLKNRSSFTRSSSTGTITTATTTTTTGGASNSTTSYSYHRKSSSSNSIYNDIHNPPLYYFRGASPSKAQENWDNTLAWRKEKNVAPLLYNPPKNQILINNAFPTSIYEYDKRGNIIVIEKWGQVDMESIKKHSLTHDDVIQAYIFDLEWLWTIAAPNPTDKLTLVMDVGNVTFDQFTSWSTVKLISERMKIGCSYYPNRGASLLLINVPSWFSMVYRIAIPLLNEQTKAKVKIMTSKEVSESSCDNPNFITTIIAPENMLTEYGGTSTIPFGQSSNDIKKLNHIHKYSSSSSNTVTAAKTTDKGGVVAESTHTRQAGVSSTNNSNDAVDNNETFCTSYCGIIWSMCYYLCD